MSERETLLRAILSERWYGHNIALDETRSTIGSDVPLIRDDNRTRVIKSAIRRFLPGRSDLRIADLGSLEGGLSLEMAREGWNVVGIEAREANYQKAELIRRWFDLPNLRFELRDVKSLDPSRDGTFDAILCCGLLYHLDNPFAFLERLRALVSPGGLLFLDTHVAPDIHAEPYGTHAANLSDDTTFEHGGHTYEGRWFREPREGGSRLDEQWSAVSNERSFWPTRRALIRALYHAGFHSIHELFGMFEIDREFGLRDQFSRLYLVCLPEM